MPSPAANISTDTARIDIEVFPLWPSLFPDIGFALDTDGEQEP